MNLADLAVQTYCFRAFKDNRDVVAAVRECGLANVELSSVHVNYADDEEADKALEVYRSAGIGIVGMGVIPLKNDEAALRKAFEFTKRAGGSVVSISFAPSGFEDVTRIAAGLAEEYDLLLAIHNHGGRHWLGNTQMLRHVFSVTSERIGLCLDTAWALDAGEDPVAMAKTFRNRLYSLHLKDFVFDRARKPEDVPVGTGNLDLKGLLAYLEESGFAGPLILEYEGDVDNPVPAVKKCVEGVRRQWSEVSPGGTQQA